MPRPSKPPRLYLRAGRKGHAAKWVILDGPKETGTGAGAEDIAAAERALEDYLASKRQPPTSGCLNEILIDDILTIYLEEVAATSPSREWLCHTAAPVLDWWSGKALIDVRGKTCRDYVAWRTAQTIKHTERQISDQTARHELKTLRAAINHFHGEHGPLASVPKVSLPARAPQRTDYWLTRQEAAARLRVARRREETWHVARMILIGIYTGTRPGAILKLQWLPSASGGWIDLERSVIHRQAAGARQTRKKATPVRIHRRLMAFLSHWRERDLASGIANVISYRGRPVVKLRRSWSSVRIAAGHDARVDGPHILRHTAATWLMQAGVDSAEAADFLGMTPETLWNEYGHHHPDFQETAANAVARRPRNAQETTRGKVIKVAFNRG